MSIHGLFILGPRRSILIRMKFRSVLVIYNPNSTGRSRANATEFKEQLLNAGFTGEIKLISTRYAGHAEKLVADYANKETLIVSSSGDGGYNEVVNGVIQEGSPAAVAVLPSGNANDHHTANTTGELIGNILIGKTTRLEALKVEASVDESYWQRYAHSYVGFGLTPKVGKILTDKRPNALTEKWYVLKHVFDFKHVTLIKDGDRHRYDNFICAVITRMSKVVKLDEYASSDDGLMEVYETKHLSLLEAVRTFYRAATSGIRNDSRVHALTVTTVKPTLVQLDGEVFTIDADTDVVITCQKGILRTVL